MNIQVKQIKAIIGLLKQQKIPYAVIGGIAVSLYGEPRYTADIDINVIINKGDVKNFILKCKRIGFALNSRNNDNVFDFYGVIPLVFKKNKQIGKVDIIIAENLLEYQAIKRAKNKKIDNSFIRFISPEDLIIHKIVSIRQKDQEDVKSIINRQIATLDVGYIEDCLRKIDRIDKNICVVRKFKELLKQCKRDLSVK
jgi:hypothetical protein